MKSFAGTADISIRHSRHVTEAALAGADVATVPPAVLMQIIDRPLADKGLARSVADWKKTGQSIL